MPIKKSFKKKPIRKVKKMVKRKVSNSTSKITNALANVSIHHNKLLSSLFDKVWFECRAMKEQENNAAVQDQIPGYIPINLNTVTAASREYPLHLFDLTAVNNDSGVPYCPMLCYKTTAADFPFFETKTEFPTLVSLGANDNGAYSQTQSLNKTLQEYYDIRLELFPRNSYVTEYEVSIIRLLDESIAPRLIAVNGTQDQVHNSFWKNQVRPYFTNTLAPTDPRITSDLKGKHQVMWSKVYKVAEKKNDVESFVPKRVKIFKQINKVLRFNSSPQAVTTASDNPNTYLTGTEAGACTNQAVIKERIYLMIKANQTIDTKPMGFDISAPYSYDIASYSLYFKSKHVVPQSGV